MTKKHFLSFAQMLRRLQPAPSHPDFIPRRAQWLEHCAALANELSLWSPRFKRPLFYQACGANELI